MRSFYWGTVDARGHAKCGPYEPELPPAELDWYMWLGQAPLTDYRTRRCHYE